MNRREYAASKGITVERLREEEMAFLQCEGYDDDGNEYETLGAWLGRRTRGKIDEEEAMILACERGEICGAL